MTKPHVHSGAWCGVELPVETLRLCPILNFTPLKKILPGAQCLWSNKQGLKKLWNILPKPSKDTHLQIIQTPKLVVGKLKSTVEDPFHSPVIILFRKKKAKRTKKKRRKKKTWKVWQCLNENQKEKKPNWIRWSRSKLRVCKCQCWGRSAEPAAQDEMRVPWRKQTSFAPHTWFSGMPQAPLVTQHCHSGDETCRLPSTLHCTGWALH